jgi:serine/threonine protein kinase/Tol biopolymer transport system component
MTPERYRQVGQVFRAAAEIPPDRRDAFLDVACSQDQALRQEVESLLGHDSQGEGWIDQRAVDVAAQALASTPSESWVGRQVHCYDVSSLLGRGGMGEVYRARDRRLQREVALKVLPIVYSTDPERMRRFEQEARTAGRLNHPNILTVYDVGVIDGAPYIVTELLEGEELREQLNRGAIAQRRVLAYARQIADGLAAAHAKGIVHRDLKPENIFVTIDERVKILDFGLAKLKEPAGTIETFQQPNTTPGVVMGTANYMAPEQVRGQEAEQSSDIFALGVILYEMLRGDRPFSGESGIEVMNSILTDDPPDLSQTNPDIPLVLAKIVRRCLEKKPEQRFQSASDLSFALEALMSVGSGSIPIESAAPPATRRRLHWMVPVIAMVVAAMIVASYLNRSDYWWSNPLANARFTPLTDFPGTEGDAAISRDGKFVSFLSDRDGPFDVWVGQIGTGSFNNLTKGQIADMRNPEVRSLGFSPDGSLISFWVRAPNRTTVWTVPTMGGTTMPYLNGPELDWSSDGTRMVYHNSADGDPLFVTEPNEKVGKQIFVAERGVHNHFPLWSADGAFIYFVQGYPPDEMDIWRIPSTGGSPERITFHNSRVAHLTFLNQRTLLYTSTEADGSGPWLYGIDIDRRVSHRISFGVERYTSIAATSDGRRLVASVANPEANIWRVPISAGIVEESGTSRITLPTVRGLSPRIAPNYMLYLSSKGGDDGIWKLVNGAAVELWSGSLGRVLVGPAIAPDGRRIAFTARKNGRNRLYYMNSDGTSVTELAPSLNVRGAPSWPPAGEWLTVAVDQGKGAGLFKVPLNGEPAIPLVNEPATNPIWSPDSQFLVYAGVEVGTRFSLKAATADGKPYRIPEINLSRGSSRFSFLPGQPVLVVLEGEFWHKNFWSIDLVTGKRHQLTNFDREFLIGDFDISLDGKELIFGRLKESSNVILIDFPPR